MRGMLLVSFCIRFMSLHKLNTMWRFVMCFFAFALLQTATAYGKQIQCLSKNIIVHASVDRDAVDSCRGAADAMKFLASQDLSMPANITIKVVNEMPGMVMKSALGAYVREKKEVYVLTYSTLKVRSHSFKTPLNRSLYRALVSHEVAHAIAAVNFTHEPSCLAQEYIAYVTLFSVMETAQRERILRRFPQEKDWKVQSLSAYVFNSLEYGVHAYRHFIESENGKSFIWKILIGEALAEFE